MEEYSELLKKYDCKLVDGKIINKNGKDTHIKWGNVNDRNYDMSSLHEDTKKELFDTFEQLLKIAHNI